MPAHDWTRVEAGTYHAFHNLWISELVKALNGGLLPGGYYALPEQYAGDMNADVLTLQRPKREGGDPTEGTLAVATAPPRVGRRLRLSEAAAYRALRRTVTVRRESGHRVVALVEITSPGNKDRGKSVEQFVDKVHSALEAGVHVQVIDLLPPGPHDPTGLHGAIWDFYSTGRDEYEVVEDGDDAPPPAGEGPLTLSSYVAGRMPEAYVAHLDVGDTLPEMPLFLTDDRYLPLPLEATYLSAYCAMPAYYREIIEGTRRPDR